MKRTLTGFTLAACLLTTAALSDSYAQKKPAAQPKLGQAAAAAKPADEEALKAELAEVLKLDAATRVERLTAFVKANPDSPQTLRAQELLASARAALGDEKLRAGDHSAGIELFRAAVAEAPATMSDKLFVEVIAQLPANLYMLGDRGRGARTGARGRGARRRERDAPALGRLLLLRHRAARRGRAPRAGGRPAEARDVGRTPGARRGAPLLAPARRGRRGVRARRGTRPAERLVAPHAGRAEACDGQGGRGRRALP